MQSKPEPKINSANTKSAFEYFTKVVGWLQIMVSTLLIALALAALIYFLNPSKTTLVLAIGIVVLGLKVSINYFLLISYGYYLTNLLNNGCPSIEFRWKKSLNASILRVLDYDLFARSS